MSSLSIFLILTIGLPLYYPGINVNSNFIENDPDCKYDAVLKTSGYVDLTGSPINIIGNSGWNSIATTYNWCTGLGTWDNPYIIENVYIDGQNTDICINIEDSDVFFIIRNSAFRKSVQGALISDTYHDYIALGAAIRIHDADNGKLFNNSIANNRGNGIYIDSLCRNITITENSFINNDYNGIFMRDSYNNTITNNTLTNNNHMGIYTRSSYNNSITYNRIEQSYREAIILDFQSNNNKISHNNITYNQYRGIYVGRDSCNNTIIHNNVSYNEEIGIRIGRGLSDGNIISNNNINHNKEGMDIQSSYNLIFNNSICGNEYKGLGLYASSIRPCINNVILENNISNNKWGGLFLGRSDENLINNTIRGNTIENNFENGISIATYNPFLPGSLSENNITENIINRNAKYGIFLKEVGNNYIINNHIEANEYGCIEELDCFGNIIANNFCEDKYEENDIFEGSALLTTGTYSNLIANDDEWFRFYVNESYRINVTIYFKHNEGNLNLYLLSSSRYILNVSNTLLNVERVMFVVGSSDYYYVHINNSINPSYDLEIEIIPIDPDDTIEGSANIISGYNLLIIIFIFSIISLSFARRKTIQKIKPRF